MGTISHVNNTPVSLRREPEPVPKSHASSSKPGVTTTASAHARAKQGQALGARLHAELGQIKKMASDRTPSHDDPLKKVLNNADLMAHAKQEWLTPLSGIDEGDLKARNAFLNEQLIPKFARAILDQYKAVDPKKLTPEQQQDIGKLEQLAIPPRRSAPPPPPPPRRSAPPPPHAGMSHEQHLEALQQQGAKMHEMELKAAAEALERLEAKRIMDSIKFIAKMIEDWGRIGN